MPFLLNNGPALDGCLQRFRASSILPENETGELLARCRQVAAAYSRLDPDPAPGHNDLFKPDNMLFDGNRLWLVDWEAAFQNDRYADLAVVANMIVTNESEESIYLEKYFGKPPDEYQRARFYLMRQLAHMFYAIAFLTLARRVSRSTGVSPCPHTATFSAASGRARSVWRTTRRKPSTAGSIGNNSRKTCSRHVSTRP
jgi:hypothetical protein